MRLGEPTAARAPSPLASVPGGDNGRVVRYISPIGMVEPERRMLERGSELAQLGAALERAADGAPSVTVVTGEAGIGKSRLVRELGIVAQQRQDFVVLRGDCVQFDGVELPRSCGNPLFAEVLLAGRVPTDFVELPASLADALLTRMAKRRRGISACTTSSGVHGTQCGRRPVLPRALGRGC